MASNAINTNVIVPEVYAGLVREKIKGHCKVAQFLKTIDTLKGQPGETITMPCWSYIGDAADWDVKTAMTTSAMKQTEKQAQIKAVAAPGIVVHDFDNEIALGNALDEGARQQAISIARKLDIDAIAEALKSPLKVEIAEKNKVTEDEMIAMLALYGDDRDSADFDAIVVHSLFAPSFYKMSMFVDATKTMTTNGNGIAVNGVLGYFLGIPVILSDCLYDSDKQEGQILLMKHDAIGFIPKEQPFAEASRDASKRATTIYLSEFYAMALIDDSAVVHAQSASE